MEEQLSNRQRAILAFIEEFLEENGYPPTYEEIRAALGFSTKSLVNHHLEVLEATGYLSRVPKTPRSIRLMQPRTFRVPKLGQIAAGLPISVSDPDPDDYLELTRDIVAEQDGLYALQVTGNSMIDALVNDGDTVILKQQNEGPGRDHAQTLLSGEWARAPSAGQSDDASVNCTSLSGASSRESCGGHQADVVTR
jgi:repressor LexA